jgi:hypothetical protein
MFKIRSAAILLVSAGYGWAGGHYIPADSPKVAYLFQAVVIGILMILGLNFFHYHQKGIKKPNWPVRGLSIFFSLSLVINVLNIFHGAYSNDKSFGSHNSFADLVPIGLIIVSALGWFSTFFIKKGSPT